MFTGLVEAMGTIRSLTRPNSAVEAADLVVDIPFARELQNGESVAIDGCCLTVVGIDGKEVRFQAGPETLKRTTLGERKSGDPVNLERALRADARFGGHFVQGHVDGVGEVVARDRNGEWENVRITVGSLMREVVAKGSIAVDGVSLTVVDADSESLSVMLIPHTMQATTLGRRQVGSHVNIETDMLAKHVWKMTQEWQPRNTESQ